MPGPRARRRAGAWIDTRDLRTGEAAAEMEIGLAIFLTDYTIEPTRLGRLVEERGFDSLLFTEHTHIPVSRETPRPGGGELAAGVQPLQRSVRRAGDGGGGHGAAQDWHRHLPRRRARSDRHREGGGHARPSLRRPRAVRCGRRAGTSRRCAITARIPGRRFPVMRERVEAMKAIWTHDEAEYHGEHVNFDPIWSWPKPRQKPHPPVMVGGTGGEGARSRAGLR